MPLTHPPHLFLLSTSLISGRTRCSSFILYLMNQSFLQGVVIPFFRENHNLSTWCAHYYCANTASRPSELENIYIHICNYSPPSIYTGFTSRDSNRWQTVFIVLQPFYIRDLSIHKFWYLWGLQEQIPHGY